MKKVTIVLGILTVASLMALTATSWALIQKSSEINSLRLELWQKEKIQLAFVDVIVMASRDAKLGGYTRVSFGKGVSEVTIHWENDDPETGKALTVQVRAECPKEPYYLCDWKDRSPVETIFLVDD